jgi:carbon-monoxide dehydrogenase medium subunit
MSVTFARPTSVAEAIERLADDDTFALAGGVSLVLLMNTGFVFPSHLVLLDRIDEMFGVRAVSEDGRDVIDIGAMTTHSEIVNSPVVQGSLGAMSDAFSRVGNIRVRSAGTIGGNLVHADPAQDPPVVLAALGAIVVAQGPDGRREIPVADLMDGPFSTVLADDELITRVLVPVLPSGARSTFLKFLPNSADDYATVNVAAYLDFDGDGAATEARLALGAVGPAVNVVTDIAATLIGHRLDDAVIASVSERVRDSVDPSDDARGSADYKREMAGVMTARALRRCLEAES